MVVGGLNFIEEEKTTQKKYANQNNLSITIDKKSDYLNLKKLIQKEGIYLDNSKIISFLKRENIIKKIYKSSFKLKTKKYDVRFR